MAGAVRHLILASEWTGVEGGPEEGEATTCALHTISVGRRAACAGRGCLASCILKAFFENSLEVRIEFRLYFYVMF